MVHFHQWKSWWVSWNCSSDFIVTFFIELLKIAFCAFLLTCWWSCTCWDTSSIFSLSSAVFVIHFHQCTCCTCYSNSSIVTLLIKLLKIIWLTCLSSWGNRCTSCGLGSFSAILMIEAHQSATSNIIIAFLIKLHEIVLLALLLSRNDWSASLLLGSTSTVFVVHFH